MNGSRCPTCIEGAVGSTPTYAPISFCVRSQSSCSRPLSNLSAVFSPQRSTSIPGNIFYKASLFQDGQHALFLAILYLIGPLFPLRCCSCRVHDLLTPGTLL